TNKRVNFLAHGFSLGPASLTNTNRYEFQWNLVGGGEYDLTAVATNEAGSTTSNPIHITVNPLAGGFLTASVTQSPASVNLTAQGTLDWAHWGRGSASGFDRKAGAPQ